MYSIDINLLNDRPEYGQAAVSSQQFDQADKTPLYLGVAFAGALVALVLASTGVMSLLNQRLTAQEAELDQKLAELAPQLAELDSLKQEEKQVRAETQALARVFNQIKPWSATLQDIRDRVPPTLQLTKIVQSDAAPPKPAEDGKGAPPPPATSKLKISGKALSFGDVNDFVLTLRKSPFLQGEKTELVSSQRGSGGKDKVSLVDHQLRTEMSQVPASELLQVLRSKGAAGLVTRIETLKQQGVVQK